MGITLIYYNEDGSIKNYYTNEDKLPINEQSQKYKDLLKKLNKNKSEFNNITNVNSSTPINQKEKHFKIFLNSKINILKKKDNKKINNISKHKSLHNKFKISFKKIKKSSNKKDKIKQEEFIYNWGEIMAIKKLFNDYHETYTPTDILFTDYGIKTRIYIPSGFSYMELEKIIPSIQNNLQCTLALDTYTDKRYVDAKFIYIENCNKKPFVPAPVKPYEFFIGVNESCEPILINMNVTPHILIAGNTGSGKNGTLDHGITSLINSCDESDVNLYLYQGDKEDMIKYANCKQVKTFMSIDGNLNKIDKELDYIVKTEMVQRKKTMRDMYKNMKGTNIFDFNKLYPNKKIPYIYIVFDEFLSIAELAISKKNKTAENIISNLTRIGQIGRSYGVFYVISHQKPEVKLMPTFCKNQSNVRICYSVQDAICSEIVLGQGNTQAFKLPSRKAYYCSSFKSGYLYTLDLTNRISPYIKKSYMNKEEDNKKDNNVDLSLNLKTIPISNNSKHPSISVTKDIKQNNTFTKVTPKTKEEILKENISKIEGWVPYNPPKIN